MTIDRLLNAAAPRIEKSGSLLEQPSAQVGEEAAMTPGKSAFSSVLSAMTEEGTDAVADRVDVTAVQGVQPGEAQLLPMPGPVPLQDTLAALSPWAESFHPEAATLAQYPMGETAVGLPAARPGEAYAGAKGAQRPVTGASVSGPVDDGGGQASEAGTVPSAVTSALMRRPMAAGAQNGVAVTAASDGGTGLAGDGQRAADVAVGTVRADWRLATAALAEQGAATAAPWSESAGSSFRALPALRGLDRASGRAVFLPLDATAPGSVASPGNMTSLTSGFAPAATMDAPMAPGASSDVAHKVHYWITRGVQSAELQLDVLGGSAIDVSITLQGKEALVDFRSDQPEARRVLQEAMPQLREMLRAEGLQLAGGFVGSSAQQKDGNTRRDGQDRPSERVGSVILSGADAVRTGRTGAASAHALDVFV